MSAEYSYIKTIEVTNFMSIEHAVLEYDDSNIISICGLNDSGKSAITRAVSVLLYDNYSRDQVKFIKEGTEFFEIKMTFSDGVEVSKAKSISGVSIWTLSQNGNVLYTNKLKTGIQAVSDVPDIIKKYLGVLYDECTDSLINVRRNSDRLFLIDTTGGDNYKILNTILKSDILAKASINMTADKNKLNNELQVEANTFNTLVQQYESMDVAPEEDVEKLNQLTKWLSETNLRYMDIQKVYEAKKAIDEAIIAEELDVLDTSRYNAIMGIRVDYEASKVAIPDEVELIDTQRLALLEEIKKAYKASCEVVSPEVNGVSMEQFSDISELARAYVEYTKIEKSYQATENEYNAVCSELKALAEQHNIKICKNCGSVVE